MVSQTARACPLAGALAERLRDSRSELTHRWLDRIASRVAIDPNRVSRMEKEARQLVPRHDGLPSCSILARRSRVATDLRGRRCQSSARRCNSAR